jgi:hypothetical protein
MLQNYIGSTGSEFAIKSASLTTGQSSGAQLTAAYRSVTLHYNYSNGSYLYNSAASGPNQNFTIDIPMSMWSISPIARTMTIEMQYNTNPNGVSAGALVQQPVFLGKVIWTPWKF